MPEPIIVPTTIARLIHGPRPRLAGVSIASSTPASGIDFPPTHLAAGRCLPRPRGKTYTNGDNVRAFLFPGQGSQAVGMGVALSDASRAARDVFEQVDEELGENLLRRVRGGPG